MASKTKVRLLVAMSEADLGQAAAAGDEVELDADVAERYVAAGIAEEAGSQAASSSDAGEEPDKPAGRTGRR